MALRFCGQVNALTAKSFTGEYEPTIPIRFFTTSLMEVYSKFDLSYPYEADLFFNIYPEVFEEALEDCWPDRPYYQKAVYYTTKAAVIEGKALGIIGQIGIAKAATTLLYSIGKTSQTLANSIGVSFLTLFGIGVYHIKKDVTEVEKEQDNQSLEGLLQDKLDERILIIEQQISICENDCDELKHSLALLQNAKEKSLVEDH